MNLLIAIIASLLPVVIIIAIIYNQGEIKKQPLWILGLLFMGGILSWIMVRYISKYLGNDIYKSQVEISKNLGNKGFFLVSFGIIALIEEISKYIVIAIMCFKNKYFKNPYDAIMYSVCISLGFAFVENIMYINNFGVNVAISRAIFSIPAHASFGIIMGYYLGISKLCMDNKNNSYSALTRYCAFFIPFVFHGFYDFLLNFDTNTIYIVFLIYIIIMYAFVIFLLFRLKKVDDKWLRHQKKNNNGVYTVRKPVHKNIYYKQINDDSIKVSDDDCNTLIQSGWKNSENNGEVYENNNIEMKMFRDDK